MTAPPDRSSTSAVAVLDHAALRYGSPADPVHAVTDVSLLIHGGERMAVTGPSGSGKSSLLHLLAGLAAPTSGTVTWPALGGHPLAAPGRVALVFQGPSLMPELDAADNVAFPLLLAGVPDGAARTRARAALDHLGIGALADALPDQLSGGQGQRVALARAVVTAPRLILADEPTGQLDREAARQVLDVLERTADTVGAALIVSTHDPVVAARLPRRLAMSDGRLLTDVAAAPTAAGRST